MQYLHKPGQQGAGTWQFVAAVLLALVGTLDALTGSEVAFALFYLIPVALLTWFAGRNAGLVMCVCAAAVWWLADWVGDPAEAASSLVRLWNAGVRLGMFVVVCMLLSALMALRGEQKLARVDPLTGAANRRRLCEALHLELMRSRRYGRPLTIAFIDLDGFKAVNDGLGHSSGDRLLCTVVETVNQTVRETDLFARVGGDEFVLLLPEIDQDAAQVIMPKLQRALQDRLQQHQWPVTFSIGVLTWLGGAVGAEELVALADRQMYDIKRGGKDAIAYAVHGPDSDSDPDPQPKPQPRATVTDPAPLANS